MNGWEKILCKASRLLLKQLKHYHRTMVFQLQQQIEKQEGYVKRRRDFKDSISDIHEFANKIYQHHDLKKKKKLERLQKPSQKG